VKDLIVLQASRNLKDRKCIACPCTRTTYYSLTISFRGVRVRSGILEGHHLEIRVSGKEQEIAPGRRCSGSHWRLPLVKAIHDDRVVTRGGKLPSRCGLTSLVQVVKDGYAAHVEPQRQSLEMGTAVAIQPADLHIQRARSLTQRESSQPRSAE
jgi:hypothetical protein